MKDGGRGRNPEESMYTYLENGRVTRVLGNVHPACRQWGYVHERGVKRSQKTTQYVKRRGYIWPTPIQIIFYCLLFFLAFCHICCAETLYLSSLTPSPKKIIINNFGLFFIVRDLHIIFKYSL